MLNKWMMIAMVFALVMSLGLVVACGDDDDDDDDDTTGDDDDDDKGAIYDECMTFYTECGGYNEEQLAAACDALTGLTECLEAAYTDFFECMNTNVDCNDFAGSAEAAATCAETLTAAMDDCA